MGCLTALLTLFSCAKETNVKENNPTYDPIKKEVTTQFVLNVSTNAGPETKMTAEAVQAGGNFRGMEAVHLLAYNLTYGDHLYKVGDASSVALRDFDLGSLLLKDEITGAKSSRVVELTLPTGTNTLMLYGKASKSDSADANDKEGKVDLSGTALGTTLDNVVFRLSDRLENQAGFNQFTEVVCKMLTGFFRTGLIEELPADGFNTYRDLRYAFWFPYTSTSAAFDVRKSDGSFLFSNGTEGTGSQADYTYYCGSKTWRDYGRQYKLDKDSMKPLEEDLGRVYSEFTTIKSNAGGDELRAGSTRAIIRTISDMYQVIDKVANAVATSYQEQVAIFMAKELQERINRYFTVEGTSVEFKSITAMDESFQTYIGKSLKTDFPELTDTYFSSAVGVGFPLNLNIPAGAAILDCITKTLNGKDYEDFYYRTEIPAYGMGENAPEFPIANYRYPAELMYWANSPIRVSDDVHPVSYYPVDVTSWDNAENGKWNDGSWKVGSVASTTRSVAMIDQVNYGNALLCSVVKYAEGLSNMNDNRSALFEGETDKEVPCNSTSLQVTGILIGGQPDKVGWDFLPYDAADNKFNKMVYDKTTPFLIPATGSSANVYTLLWDNYDKSLANDAQGEVYVGLELVNNTGEDFWGELNLVRNGGTFYLLGKLDPKAASTTKPTTLARDNFWYPPFDESGNTVYAPRVFMQDYMTEATLILGKNSLKHAYVTVPDLRASQVSMGLSVDLKWETGMNFQVIMGGE